MAFVSLPGPPDLGIISCLEFTPNSNSLLVASHDRQTLLFTCDNNGSGPLAQLTAEIKTPSPIMGIAHSSHTAYAGCLDGTLRQLDYENTRMTTPIANIHDDAHRSQINHLKAIDSSLLVFTGVDGLIRYYDPRSGRIVDSHNCSSKLFAMDVTSRYLTVGLAESQVQVFDLRKRDHPWQARASGLRYQMTCIRSLPLEDGFALSSVDGRVSMEYFDLLEENQQKKFAFKCHRQTDKATMKDTVYPVTGLRFHKRYNTLFTSGGDGNVYVWNWEKRRRMRHLPLQDPRCISHLDISDDGSLMAVGVIDDGFMRLPDADAPFEARPSEIYLRRLDEIDCRPKSK